DSSWNISSKHEGNKVIYTARKKFESVAAMNAELYNEENGGVRLNVRGTLGKRFRWFFTFMKYREEYRPIFKKIPISQAMTREELAVLLEEEDVLDSIKVPEDFRDKVQAKAEAWLKENVFVEFYDLFLEGAKRLKDPKLTLEFISSHKNELYENMQSDPDEISDLFESFEAVLKTPAVWKVAEMDSAAFKLFDEKLAFVFGAFWNDYTVNVTMPGLIVGTNAPTVKGNTISWGEKDGDELRMFLIGHELWVESRIVNWWTVYVSGAIVLLFFISMAVSLPSRKTQLGNA
ncbi:MAG: hypothetical protein ACE5G1_12750, partial [bacterium]